MPIDDYLPINVLPYDDKIEVLEEFKINIQNDRYKILIELAGK